MPWHIQVMRSPVTALALLALCSLPLACVDGPAGADRDGRDERDDDVLGGEGEGEAGGDGRETAVDPGGEGEGEASSGEGEGESTPPRSGCGQAPPSSSTLTVRHEGRERRAIVSLPEGYDRARPTPVVLNFHGRTMRPSQQQLVTGMDDDASDRGAIVVYPEGVGGTWQAGVCCNDAGEDVDDLGFTAALLDALEAAYCVDVDRVYATGLSNGGFMAHHLACQMADRITAIAAVSGPEGSPGCDPGRAVPVLHIHGTADNVVAYNGFGGFVSAPGTFDAWGERNGCGSTTTTTYQRGDVTCVRKDGCDAPVELCTIDGGGHQWPGGMTIPGLGDNTRDLDANTAILDFFEL